MVPIRYFVVRCNDKWRVEFEHEYKNGFNSKTEAIRYAVGIARAKTQEGKSCQVLVNEEDKSWYTIYP